MTFTAAQLASEINADPATIGYAANVAAGADASVAAQLNAIGAGNGYVVNALPISVDLFTALIDRTEYETNTTQAQRDYLRMLTSTATVNINHPIIKAALNTLFTQALYPTTRSHLIAALTRQGSRAEVLWGTGATVGAGDVSHAIRGS